MRQVFRQVNIVELERSELECHAIPDADPGGSAHAAIDIETVRPSLRRHQCRVKGVAVDRPGDTDASFLGESSERDAHARGHIDKRVDPRPYRSLLGRSCPR
jgi:hypothetical protein